MVILPLFTTKSHIFLRNMLLSSKTFQALHQSSKSDHGKHLKIARIYRRYGQKDGKKNQTDRQSDLRKSMKKGGGESMVWSKLETLAFFCSQTPEMSSYFFVEYTLLRANHLECCFKKMSADERKVKSVTEDASLGKWREVKSENKEEKSIKKRE